MTSQAAVLLAGSAASQVGGLVYKSDKSPTTWRRLCPRGFQTPEGFLVGCGRRDCLVCGPRRARETARMLLIEAREGQPPTHAVTLTTQDPEQSARSIMDGSRNVWRSLRRWSCYPVEYFSRAEFSTGKAITSGGFRRFHQHAATRLPDVDVDEATERVRHAWMAKVSGAWRVEVAKLRTESGLLHYLALHHAKAEQQPPPWWSGRTERVSRGFWTVAAAPELRQRARIELHAERLAHVKGWPLDRARRLVDYRANERGEVRRLVKAWHDERLERLRDGVFVPESDFQLAIAGDADIPF